MKYLFILLDLIRNCRVEFARKLIRFFYFATLFREHSSLTNRSSSSSQKMTEFKRLPSNVLPVNYVLEFTPNLAEFTFSGRAIIDVNVNEATSQILLNSAELHFDKAVFEYANGTKVQTSNVALNEESELATLTFPQAINVGAGKLHIDFTGLLNDKLKGFYRSKYRHPNGEERYAATTQFEAADARRAFPCWDEPALKATFEIAIVADQSKTVLSNMVSTFLAFPNPQWSINKIFTYIKASNRRDARRGNIETISFRANTDHVHILGGLRDRRVRFH